jgi:hypothetical protein
VRKKKKKALKKQNNGGDGRPYRADVVDEKKGRRALVEYGVGCRAGGLCRQHHRPDADT